LEAEDITMRILGLIILMVLTVQLAPLALAQTYDPHYPVCKELSEWGGWRIDCSFTLIAQCRASASGRAATCMLNPYSHWADRTAATEAVAALRTQLGKISANDPPSTLWPGEW
jgi:hypothetical protein